MANVKITELPAATSSAGTDVFIIQQGATTKQITNTLVFTNSVLTTPNIGTPSAGNLVNCTNYPLTSLTGLGANVATFLGTPSSANLAAAVTDETGTGALVFANSPAFTTPDIGAATATTVNNIALTPALTGATITLADGKTVTFSNTMTFAGTDATTMTFPTTSATIARTDAAQSFTGDQTFANIIRSGFLATSAAAPTIASATTIAPTTSIVFVSGTTAIATITPPAPIASGGGQITIIPTDLWTTTTAGNIALGTTAVVSKALILTYDVTTTKWYPSY